MPDKLLWQRVRLPGVNRDYTVAEVTDVAVKMRESGSDWNVTIRRDLIASLVPADASIYGGAVKCWTLQLV
jgi:hypothetical protein